MSAYEAYYRSETFIFTGAFFINGLEDRIREWASVYTNDDIYEVWSLEERNGVLYDKFSKWKFTR